MDWHALGKTAREIAQEVYGDTSDKRQAYVRIVTRQRQGGRMSPTDKKYQTSEHGRVKRRAISKRWYHHNPEAKQKRIDQAVAWQKANPEATRAIRKRYREKEACAALTNQ